MKKYWKKIFLIFGAMLLAAIIALSAGQLLTFHALKRNSDLLALFVDRHYSFSVLVLASAFLCTAFFAPGALILTVTTGFLFGALPGALYATVFSTVGATLAFLLSRYLLGGWFQKKYHRQLKRFNEEMSRHGPNYLFVLRIVPLMPAFVLNYLSGLTRMSTLRFAVVSLIGLCPGALVYSLAGTQLRIIESPKDILSVKVMIGFWILAIFALLPVLIDLASHAFRERPGHAKVHRREHRAEHKAHRGEHHREHRGEH